MDLLEQYKKQMLRPKEGGPQRHQRENPYSTSIFVQYGFDSDTVEVQVEEVRLSTRREAEPIFQMGSAIRRFEASRFVEIRLTVMTSYRLEDVPSIERIGLQNGTWLEAPMLTDHRVLADNYQTLYVYEFMSRQ